ncbi:MAG TPA: D-glycerate dehydrogenase [Ignavibacteriaceae bacterium]|nr:D-glycerate dehydrogenase [Ignavibacteriaceae bacterium]
MKVYIAGDIPEIGIDYLREKGLKISLNKKLISEQDFIRNAKDCNGIVTLLSQKITKDIIDSLPKLKVIANYAVGYNNIDIAYAKEKGIIVTNTPDVLTAATAEIAVSLMLSCNRRIVESENFVRDGKFSGWQPKLFLGKEIKNKTVGIIGGGRIGTATALRIKAFETNILYYSNHRNPLLEEKTDARKVSLDTLLKKSDIISIHLPLTPSTRNLLSKEKLGLLKKSSVVINTARGEIIDEKELIRKLKKNEIFAAGFDVYENEPNLNKELFKLKNAVLLPHIGSATEEARNEMSLLCAKNIANVLNNKKPLTEV